MHTRCAAVLLIRRRTRGAGAAYDVCTGCAAVLLFHTLTSSSYSRCTPVGPGLSCGGLPTGAQNLIFSKGRAKGNAIFRSPTAGWKFGAWVLFFSKGKGTENHFF